MMENDIKSSKHAIKAEKHKVENRRSRRNVVTLFPEQDPGPKAGVADAKMGGMKAHVIQTPGKDQTIVDVNMGKENAKVNLPKESPGPVKGTTGNGNGNGTGQGNTRPQTEDESLFGGLGQNLSGKNGPLNGGPGIEASLAYAAHLRIYLVY
jgi:hypothetical protein